MLRISRSTFHESQAGTLGQAGAVIVAASAGQLAVTGNAQRLCDLVADRDTDARTGRGSTRTRG